MTVSAVEARTGRPKRRNPVLARGDRLVPFSEAAPRLSKTPETLRKWHGEGHLPAVVSPGGQWSTFESFIGAVLASARPGQPGVIEEIARAWFGQRVVPGDGRPPGFSG
jgi:hypothetical protein